MRARALGASLVLGLLAAPLITSLVDARPVAKSTVAVFANPSYVDAAPVGQGGELPNIVDDLEAAGHTVREFTDESADGFTAALDGADVLLIPELEEDEKLYGDLTPEAAAVITDFVEGGGRMVMSYSDHAVSGLNVLFGFATTTTDGCDEGGDPTCILTPEAADTEFADGPATLNGVDATDGIAIDSLPAGSTVIYRFDPILVQSAGEGGSVPAASVAAVPVGDGVIITLGWDWFPDSECCDEESISSASVDDEVDWATVLDLAVSQPTVTASSPVAGKVTFTSDSPSTQPAFVVAVVDGETITVTIPAKATSGTADLPDGGSVAWSVPGWGVGEGSVNVLAANAAPVPVPAAPTFTG